VEELKFMLPAERERERERELISFKRTKYAEMK